LLYARQIEGLSLEGGPEEFRGVDGIPLDSAPEELEKWWDRILVTAKEICNDPQGKLINSDVLLEQNNEIKPEDIEKGRACMRRAIEQHLKSMPKITQEVFMEIIKNFGSKTSTSSNGYLQG
jgi:hypothetical protein